MIDATTKRPLEVLTGGDAGPYIIVPEQQLERVRKLLDGHGIEYWVDEFAISIDEEPETTVINLSYNTDAAAVQKVLDSAR